jgi:hypothetical protein
MNHPAKFDSSACPGFSATRMLRRSALQIGTLGAFSLGTTSLLNARKLAAASNTVIPAAQGPGFGQAKAVILLFMWGGPSHIDTWDLKPKAPTEVRGEFNPIETSVPGIEISEHFPLLARRADRYAIVRSVTHDDPAHLSSVHVFTTGHPAPTPKSDSVPPSRRDQPHLGSVLTHLRPPTGLIPGFVTLPWLVSHPAAPGGMAVGQHAGWMGQALDPFVITGDPNDPSFRVSGLDLIPGVSRDRITHRRRLLDRMHSAAVNAGEFDGMQSRALDMLTNDSVQRAFAIADEPAALREKYGRHIHGQSLLLSRRLVEAGVPLVCVNWHQDHANFWDTHGSNFVRLKSQLMPPADRGFSALLDDLSERGLLDSTLVLWVGEFGRNPKINGSDAGRDHWPWCSSAVFAGGGIQGGQVFGRSDSIGGRPAENPVSPADLHATLCHALGIPPDTVLHDREQRPHGLTTGNPLTSLFQEKSSVA